MTLKPDVVTLLVAAFCCGLSCAQGRDTRAAADPPIATGPSSAPATRPVAVRVSPGTYWPESACTIVKFPEAPRTGWKWCVDRIVARESGELEFHCSWTIFGFGVSVDKGPDEGNRNMYLTDQTGRRYDHFATTDAAKFGGRLVAEQSVHGSFVFPPPLTPDPIFAFRDDDQKVVVGNIRADPARRTSSAESQAVLGKIRQAERVEIKSVNAGLGGSNSSVHAFRREGDHVVGAAIPTIALDQFLLLLAEAPLLRSKYQPYWDHTDDDPFLSIDLAAGGESVVFFSQSQGARRVPWAVRVGGTTFVVPSDAPAQALDVLEPFLNPKQARPPEVSTATRRSDGASAERLRVAAQQGDLTTLRALLAQGLDVNAPTAYDGETPLTAAVLSGRRDAVKELLAAGADPLVKTPRGDALSIAAGLGASDIVRLLTEAAGRHGGMPSRGQPALGLAVANGQVEAVRSLLAAGADVTAQSAEQGTVLHLAAREGFAEIAKLLVESGAAVDAKDAEGATPLAEAARNGHLEVVRSLLKMGARADTREKGGKALGRASRNGHLAIVQELIAAGADVNDGGGPREWPPLLGTLAPDVVRALLQAGADVNPKQGGWNPPLIVAVSSIGGRLSVGNRHVEGSLNNRNETVKALLKAGAAPDVTDSNGRSPLIWAASAASGRPDVALFKVLVEAGARVNQRDKDGRTALFYAATSWTANGHRLGQSWDKDAVDLLLKSGADANLADKNGDTVLKAVSAERDASMREIQALLESAGARPR